MPTSLTWLTQTVRKPNEISFNLLSTTHSHMTLVFWLKMYSAKYLSNSFSTWLKMERNQILTVTINIGTESKYLKVTTVKTKEIKINLLLNRKRRKSDYLIYISTQPLILLFDYNLNLAVLFSSIFLNIYEPILIDYPQIFYILTKCLFIIIKYQKIVNTVQGEWNCNK